MKKGVMLLFQIVIFILGVIVGMFVITKNLDGGLGQIPRLLRWKCALVPYKSAERKKDSTRLEIVGDVSKCARFTEYSSAKKIMSSGYIVEGILMGSAIVSGQRGTYADGIFYPNRAADTKETIAIKKDDYNIHNFEFEFEGHSKDKILLQKKKYKLGHLIYNAEYDDSGKLLSENKFQFDNKL